MVESSFSKEKQEHIKSYGGEPLLLSSDIFNSIHTRLKSWNIVLDENQAAALIADIQSWVK